MIPHYYASVHQLASSARSQPSCPAPFIYAPTLEPGFAQAPLAKRARKKSFCLSQSPHGTQRRPKNE